MKYLGGGTGERYYLLNNMSFTGFLTGKHFVSPIKHFQFTDMFIRLQKQTRMKAIKVIAVMWEKILACCRDE